MHRTSCGDAAWSADGKRFAVGLYSQDETAQRINYWDTGMAVGGSAVPGIGVSVVSLVAGRPAVGGAVILVCLYGIWREAGSRRAKRICPLGDRDCLVVRGDRLVATPIWPMVSACGFG